MANIKQIKIGNTLHEINAKYWNGKEASSKQDKLVSGSNIKTINSESLLGTGNIEIAPITSDELSLIFTEFDNVGSGYGLSGYGISESLIEETENE